MPIHLDPVCLVLRAGRHMKKHGDAYEISGTVIFEEEGVARIVGTSGKLYPGFMADVKQYARENGIRKVIWERQRNGVEKKVILVIPPE